MRSLLWRLIDRWRAPAPPAQRVEWLYNWQFAHRGLHGKARVENSMSAFSAALNAGMGIECDVQASVDGRAIIFHDWTLDRLTGHRGPVGHRTVGELTHTALLDSADNIATLHDLLKLVRGRVPLLVEVKTRNTGRVERICLAVRRELEGYPGPVAVMSFDSRVVSWFARYADSICRGLVMSEKNARTLSGAIRRHLALWRARPDFLAYDVRDLPSRFAAMQRRRGMPVLTWTVDQPGLVGLAAQYADAPIAEGSGVV
ncbi:glycerophosphodiester phosphodiesterase [Altericroceibacterium spongiae]|uniref:Glycerophosphodiester phosphodiesterase n=1 Tax=Altericroceibacterium spongiae TaxID=2320269 RepID=A0A420EIR4_9SPHN|nr:glycerophosphodiester phosphodiesterase family protein [Altericroceibacterium spongiae]RKF20595.1 glycerophosphodiester phosphodiesterase [Altericroceibacterium spongiae]